MAVDTPGERQEHWRRAVKSLKSEDRHLDDTWMAFIVCRNENPAIARTCKVSGLPVFEMEAASSSSETRLFCCFSPEKRTSVAPANPQSNIDNKIGAIGIIFIEGRRERVLHEFHE